MTDTNTMRRILRGSALALGLCAAAACGGDEDDPTGGGHTTVEDAAIYAEGEPLTTPIGLPEGETIRLEVRFLDRDGAPISGLRPGHDAALVFDPATVAAAAAVADDDGFFFDVTATGAAGTTAVVWVGYGHEGHTDEATFGPFEVVVVGIVE